MTEMCQLWKSTHTQRKQYISYNAVYSFVTNMYGQAVGSHNFDIVFYGCTSGCLHLMADVLTFEALTISRV